MQGTVFVADQGGGRAVVPGAKVSLNGSLFSQQTVSDEAADTVFQRCLRTHIRLDVRGSGAARFQQWCSWLPDKALDIPIELKAEAMKDSVTVTSSAAPADLTEPRTKRS